MKITIVIPAYNEEAGIGVFLDQLTTALIEYPNISIIVVDDASTDSTPNIIKNYDVHVITHRINLGYGAALKSGIREAKSDYVLICDSDGQHSIPDILKLSESTCYPLTIGKRVTGSHVQINRVMGKTIIKTFANFLMGRSIPDINSGLRLIDRKIVSRYLHLLPDGFSASTTMTLIFLKRGHPINWIPIKTLKRMGTSSVKQINHGFYTLLLILRMTMLFNPLKIFCSVSIFLFFIGFFWGVYYLDGGLSVFSSISLILSFITFLIGLVADQISFMRLEKFE